MIWLAFYIVDCELMNIGAMWYINGLTVYKKQVKSLVLYVFWTVTIRQNHSWIRAFFSFHWHFVRTKRSKIVTDRHVSVPQNILKMHLWSRLLPGPCWGSLQGRVRVGSPKRQAWIRHCYSLPVLHFPAEVMTDACWFLVSVAVSWVP